MRSQLTISIQTDGRGIYDILSQVAVKVMEADIGTGLCNLFCQHTSASLIVCENCDANVKVDVETFFSTLVQDGDPRFLHTDEGFDDMSAHIRTLLTQQSLQLPINNNRLALGQWQGIYLYEHRTMPKQRNLVLTVI